ncbi:MAG: dihydrolipoyl dehydrogenase [Chloroflexi bacterium]|nr:dihydrolipoyl dehydrogenase [Chloroflexota bacterium]
MSDNYDLLIIGAGPGGYVAGIRAGQLGIKAAVVEKAEVGGVCLNWGCIPSKALLDSAYLVDTIKQRGDEYGLHFSDFKADYSVAQKRSRQAVKRLTTGVKGLLRKNKCDVIEGTARLVSANEIEVQPSGQHYVAKNIIIATGSSSRNLPGVEIDGKRILTSNEAVMLTEAPASIIIVGTGAIGVEFASIFSAYGTDVTLVEMLPHILPLEDEEIAEVLHRSFTKQGIKIHVKTRVENVSTTETGVAVTVSGENGQQKLEADQVLIAIGRVPNSANLGLEQAGVHTERGFIKVDGYLRTSVPGIYAIGDIVGGALLAHKGMMEAHIAVDHIAGRPVQPIDPLNIPACTYCHPQVASVGMTEAKAREAGYQVKVGKMPFRGVGKAIAIGDYEGIVKIVAGEKYGEILGVHIVGPEATELIAEFVLARTNELTDIEIGHTIHAHPTLSEANFEAALAVEGAAIHI